MLVRLQQIEAKDLTVPATPGLLNINIILYHIILDYIRLDSGHGIGPYPPSGAELQSVQTNKY